MRKILICLISMLLIISMCACSFVPTTYTVDRNGTSYMVDTENSTIFDGTHTYQYSFSGNKSSYDINITYPDGSTYWFKMSGMSGFGGWSDDYESNRYVDGDILCQVILEEAPKESKAATPGKFLAILILGAVGIFMMVSPRTAWYLEYGWRYKNAEPSDAALVLSRLSGGVLIVAVVIWIFT